MHTDAPLPPPGALLDAWAAQSRELVLLTDRGGAVRWRNPAAARALPLAPGASLLDAAPEDWHGGAPRAALLGALRDATAMGGRRPLRGVGGAPVWVEARLARLGADLLWTLSDVTAQHAEAEQARRLAETVELAQVSGRLGTWERDLRTGFGTWDRFTFAFFDMEPRDRSPKFEEAAARVHPDDLAAFRRLEPPAERQSKRFRVVHRDGSVRWLHSQWTVRPAADGTPERMHGIMVDDTEVYELARSRDAAASQLRVLAELADLAIWRHDFATDRIHYDEHGARVLEVPYAADGLTLDAARANTHPDDVPKLLASARHALRTGEAIDVQVRHRRLGGGWRHLLVRRAIERDADGRPVAFLGVTLDITRQFEQARRAEGLAARLEAATRAAGLGIWTSRVEDAQVLDYNDQMYRLFDRLPPGLLPNAGEFFEYCVDPRDRDRFAEQVRRYVAEPVGTFEIEFRGRRRDDGLRWMVIRCDVETVAGVPQFVGIAMDVTERHAARLALDSAGARALLIARQAGIGTWEIGPDGEMLWDEQMFRLRGLAPRPRAPERDERLALVHPNDRALMIDVRPSNAIVQPTSGAEFRVRHPDGRYRWLASRSSPLHDAQGRLIARVGVNWDIDEAKNADLARQKAELAERESHAKSRFLARMSHELRTPLNAVLGFAQLLERDARGAGDAPRATTLGHIRAAGEHLLTLIDDALDLSRVETGSIKLDLRAIPLAEAVEEALPLVAALAEERGVRLVHRQLAGHVRADRTRLRQVLLNLLTNAVKYNRPAGQVTISGEPVEAVEPAGGGTGAPKEWKLRVADTGRGIRPEQLPRLFEPFNRLGLEDEGIQGSGIGLTIVKSLVEGMEGRIEVRSAVGVGTTFEIVLPAAASPAPPAAVEPAPPPTAPSPVRHVLYIEDNPVNVLLVEELLKLRPHLTMRSVPTGAEGVAAATEALPDLTLVDMQLPDFDGFEVLRRLRADPRSAGLHCIALSANALPDDVQRALAAGFDDYWTKPIQFKPFLAALDRLLPAE